MHCINYFFNTSFWSIICIVNWDFICLTLIANQRFPKRSYWSGLVSMFALWSWVTIQHFTLNIFFLKCLHDETTVNVSMFSALVKLLIFELLIDCVGWVFSPIVVPHISFINQIISLTALLAAIYSAFVGDKVTLFYL